MSYSTNDIPLDDLSIKAKLALELDLAMREQAQAGWRGDDPREKQVLNALGGRARGTPSPYWMW